MYEIPCPALSEDQGACHTHSSSEPAEWIIDKIGVIANNRHFRISSFDSCLYFFRKRRRLLKIKTLTYVYLL